MTIFCEKDTNLFEKKMISDGVIILQRLPSLSVAMDRPPSYFGSHRSVPSNLLTMGHRWLAPIGHSNCYYRNTESLMNFNHLMIQLMKQFHFCDEEEEEKKTQRGGISVGRSQSIANTLNFNKEDRPSSQVSDKLNKSDPIEKDTKKKKKSCNATTTTQEICQDKNTTSSNSESSWQSGGNTPWQIGLNVSGCDEVRAFTESGVLNVEGRRNKREQQPPVMKVQHRTTLPIGVDPETLTATLTKDGRLIVSQRKGQYGEGDVTEVNKPTNDDVTELSNPTDDDVTELSQLTSGDVTELNNINKECTVDRENL